MEFLQKRGESLKLNFWPPGLLWWRSSKEACCSGRYRINFRAPRTNQVMASNQAIAPLPDRKKSLWRNIFCNNSGYLTGKMHFRIRLVNLFWRMVRLSGQWCSECWAVGPNILGCFLFPWAWHWTLEKPPLPNPLFLVPEFRKMRKHYVKAVPEVLGDELLSFWKWKMQCISVSKCSGEKERPPGGRNIGPWSARDPMDTEPPQPFLATWKKRCTCNWEFRFQI